MSHLSVALVAFGTVIAMSAPPSTAVASALSNPAAATGPVVRLTKVPPAFTTDRTPTIHFTVSQPDDQQTPVKVYCADAPNSYPEECASPFTVPIEWSERGSSVIYVEAIDEAGNSSVAVARWTVDLAAPDLWPVRTPSAISSDRHTFRWDADDAGIGIASYDTKLSITSQTAQRMSKRWESGRLSKPRTTIRVPRGMVACLQVRATDRLGNRSSWLRMPCVARSQGHRALERRGATRILRDSRYIDGTAIQIDRGGRVVLRGVQRRSRVIVAYRRHPGGDWFRVRVRGRQSQWIDVVGTDVIGTENEPRKGWVEISRTPRRDGPVVIEGHDRARLDGLAVIPPWAFGMPRR
ncbi:hypothetical protein [Mumia sp. DW29H23]|uniref:hypothetical protein n=1 Tax=Mumia sp. DW29H23 TaxID=3421241 RepID=UPI003D68D673